MPSISGDDSVRQQQQRKAAIIPAFLALFSRFVLLILSRLKAKKGEEKQTQPGPFLPGVG